VRRARDRTRCGVGEQAAIVVGIGEVAALGADRRHLALLDRLGMHIIGDRHLARRGMAAFAVAEQLL